jgi:hypothetical protein
MTKKEQIQQTWQNVKSLFDYLKEQNLDWYSSLRIPAIELEKRLKDFMKELPDE